MYYEIIKREKSIMKTDNGSGELTPWSKCREIHKGEWKQQH